MKSPDDPETTGPYHHGDLPGVLRRSAVEVISTNGLHGFSLREVARRAGVSHAAPGYHFGDVRGLLTAVAIEGFETLRAELARSSEGIEDPVARLRALGRGYVRVAIEHPAHCEVMFRDDVIASTNADLVEAGLAAYAVLEEAVAAIAAYANPTLPVQDAARLCWSALQGLVALQGKFEHLDTVNERRIITLEEHVDRFIDLIVAGITARSRNLSGR